MNWDLIQKWTGLLANVGVLIGLVVVILEISQNTRAIESEAAWSRLERGSELLAQVTNDPEFAELEMRLSLGSAEEYLAADPLEGRRFAMHWISYVLYWETRFTTQTSDSERFSLAENIKTRLIPNLPGRMVVAFVNGEERVPEFRVFLSNILIELEALDGNL